jgi:hypothetical protein
MKEELIGFLTDLKRRGDIRGYSEEHTKLSIILKVLAITGWDVFDPEEVKSEYCVGEGRVDYALRPQAIGQNSKVFIEAKRVAEQLEPHERQLVSYATTESVRLAILTNGITWWFYLPLEVGNWDQKKFWTIDVIEQEPAQAAEKFIEFLSKCAIDSGEAITKAEAVFKDRKKDSDTSMALPLAWNRLIESADDALVNILKERAEKRCGYEIDSEAIVRFFEEHCGTLTVRTTGLRLLPTPAGPRIARPPFPNGGGRAPESTLRVTIN